MAATCKTCNGFGALYPPSGGPVECPDFCDNGQVHDGPACPFDGNILAEDGVCGFCGNAPDAEPKH